MRWEGRREWFEGCCILINEYAELGLARRGQRLEAKGSSRDWSSTASCNHATTSPH